MTWWTCELKQGLTKSLPNNCPLHQCLSSLKAGDAALMRLSWHLTQLVPYFDRFTMPQWKSFSPTWIISDCLQMASTWWTGKLWNDCSKNSQRCFESGPQNTWAIAVALDECRRFVGSGIIANALNANKWMKLPLMFWYAPAAGWDRNGLIRSLTLGYG
jgi:hypothetical protein